MRVNRAFEKSASVLLAALVLASPAFSQDSSRAPAIAWQHGPTVAKIGSLAQINVPKGYMFADAAGAKRFLELTQNFPNGDELGILTAEAEDSHWFVIFSFDAVGYVKDDEKNSLDADAMLRTIREATERANQERKRRGWATMSVTGWVQKPHYETATHNLEWSLRGEGGDGVVSINHHTRYLGRRGVMTVELVADSDTFSATLAEFRSAMKGFAYTPDNHYSAFVAGDKIAEYGLTALVIGGGAAAAAKAGLLKSLGKLLVAAWKLVVLAIAALGAALKRLFSAGRRPAVQES